MNALADLSHEEYKQKYGLGFKRFNHKPSNKLQTFRHGALDADTLPTAVDWREQKAVAEVKNQAQVGTAGRQRAPVHTAISGSRRAWLAWCP
jgi:hypothetical protein